jgi:hypothetical protein
MDWPDPITWVDSIGPTQYSDPFWFCENKEKLGLGGDLNLCPLSSLSDKFQNIKLHLILCFHIKILLPLLLTMLCIKIIVSLINDLGYIFDCLIYIIYI